MSHHSEIIEHKNKNYTLVFDDINVAQSTKIDENSYLENHYISLKEYANILSTIKFTILDNNNILFDSSKNDPNKIDFKLGMAICNVINKYLNLSKSEANKFMKSCKNFLNTDSAKTQMPHELLIASQLINKQLVLNLSDLENMPMIKYEKIQIAIKEINLHDSTQNIEN